MNRRLGMFSIDLDLIEKRPKDVRGIMEQCIVLRAETMWHKNCVDYVAICEQFPEVPMAEELTRIEWFKTAQGPWLAEYEPRKKAA